MEDKETEKEAGGNVIVYCTWLDFYSCPARVIAFDDWLNWLDLQSIPQIKLDLIQYAWLRKSEYFLLYWKMLSG